MRIVVRCLGGVGPHPSRLSAGWLGVGGPNTVQQLWLSAHLVSCPKLLHVRDDECSRSLYVDVDGRCFVG
jgi:hypothetical protein